MPRFQTSVEMTRLKLSFKECVAIVGATAVSWNEARRMTSVERRSFIVEFQDQQDRAKEDMPPPPSPPRPR